jgi:hypothetical protein
MRRSAILGFQHVLSDNAGSHMLYLQVHTSGFSLISRISK